MSLVISIWFIIYFLIFLVMVLMGYELSTMTIGMLLATSVIVSVINLIHERLVKLYERDIDRAALKKVSEIEQHRSTMH